MEWNSGFTKVHDDMTKVLEWAIKNNIKYEIGVNLLSKGNLAICLIRNNDEFVSVGQYMTTTNERLWDGTIRTIPACLTLMFHKADGTDVYSIEGHFDDLLPDIKTFLENGIANGA